MEDTRSSIASWAFGMVHTRFSSLTSTPGDLNRQDLSLHCKWLLFFSFLNHNRKIFVRGGTNAERLSSEDWKALRWCGMGSRTAVFKGEHLFCKRYACDAEYQLHHGAQP